MVSDRIHEQRRVIVTTLKIGAVYSPTVDSARKMDRKAAAVVSDDVSSGIRSSRADSTAASIGFFPAAIWVMIDSDMTMALSTSMPRAMISEASDIWSRPMFMNDMHRTADTMAMGMRLATIKPVRSPRKRSITRNTMTIAWKMLTVNSLTFFSTKKGWKVTMSNSIPIGKAS